MRQLLALLMFLPTAALAQSQHEWPQDNRQVIEQCNAVEQAYGSWAFNMREGVDNRSSDHGGRIDASLIKDINFALVNARDFVHDNIQYVQRSGALGGKPRVEDCRRITAIAQYQIEHFTWALLNDIYPEDREGRIAISDHLEMELLESTRQLQRH